MSYLDKYLPRRESRASEHEIDRLMDQLKRSEAAFESIQQRHEKQHRQLLIESIKKQTLSKREKGNMRIKASTTSAPENIVNDSFVKESSTPSVEKDQHIVMERAKMLHMMKKIGVDETAQFVRSDVFRDDIQSTYEDNVASIIADFDPQKLVGNISANVQRPSSAFQKLFLFGAIAHNLHQRSIRLGLSGAEPPRLSNSKYIIPPNRTSQSGSSTKSTRIPQSPAFAHGMPSERTSRSRMYAPPGFYTSNSMTPSGLGGKSPSFIIPHSPLPTMTGTSQLRLPTSKLALSNSFTPRRPASPSTSPNSSPTISPAASPHPGSFSSPRASDSLHSSHGSLRPGPQTQRSVAHSWNDETFKEEQLSLFESAHSSLKRGLGRSAADVESERAKVIKPGEERYVGLHETLERGDDEVLSADSDEEADEYYKKKRLERMKQKEERESVKLERESVKEEDESGEWRVKTPEPPGGDGTLRLNPRFQQLQLQAPSNDFNTKPQFSMNKSSSTRFDEMEMEIGCEPQEELDQLANETELRKEHVYSSYVTRSIELVSSQEKREEKIEKEMKEYQQRSMQRSDSLNGYAGNDRDYFQSTLEGKSGMRRSLAKRPHSSSLRGSATLVSVIRRNRLEKEKKHLSEIAIEQQLKAQHKREENEKIRAQSEVTSKDSNEIMTWLIRPPKKFPKRKKKKLSIEL
ncbi:uncharacterized protein MONOS_1446 [Monocercomonoides exilis]|uniref:uncharacterized protein n=1 Tax=Monocercomonoides exilis TaxID=2049356 RepID=UPI003559CBBB|nr:hypothetical protein MONOS_1446 [Monocercomonoides exilis]